MAAKRPAFEDFREKALQNSKVKAEYDSLAAAFHVKRQMIALRRHAESLHRRCLDLDALTQN